VPSLRDRKEDIVLLFRKFCVDFAEKYKASPIQLDDDARRVIEEYPWPGNVRELKNIAEQVSVLSKDKMVNGAIMQRFLPENKVNRLPMLAPQAHIAGNGAANDFTSERDILYKLFFDMKKDVTELKKMFLEIMHNPATASAAAAVFANEAMLHEIPSMSQLEKVIAQPTSPLPQPVIYNNEDIHEHVEVEESLNIMDKEKELIEKALKKHKGKRKDAASDLGISERTLYRKLKEYNIEE
jgi:DNA-binding NtrC family response regulator